MYGPSGKLGRGGAGKRTTHAPPINRPGRISVGGGRGGASSAAIASSSLQVEESFSLVRENPLNFGMAIKLAPDLVEVIKRVEAQGGLANIKFGSNAHNRHGNVIQVGDKSFRFTWSREPEDLCDIYEERQSGEDGNDLLVESGATWRKLNVERELDESTKNHVKRRSEEAERKLKARRSIVLDHQSPSMKNQLKDLAAAESNPWRNFKHRKEPPFKKPKSDQSSGGHPKSLNKSGLSSTNLSKVKLTSPLFSQMEQHGGHASPVGSGNVVKGHAVQNMKKAASSDKEMQSRLLNGATPDRVDHNRNTEAKPADLKNLIISLLSEHQHKGMNLKALEKAVGDSMPNSAKQIEPILKQVATFQAPGKYFLKGETENLKKPPPQTGRFVFSSPEISQHQTPAPEKFDQFPAQEPNFSERAGGKDEEEGELDSSPVHMIGTVEKIDILNDSPEQFSDKKVFDHSERLAGSSSDSGSDSSNSGSDSGSHGSKSKSPIGSQSGSSSDSESDSSTSSKQASDEDVDIMTSDDDKESKHKLQDSDPLSLKSPLTDNEFVDIGNHEMQDDYVSNMVDIEKVSPWDGCDAEKPAANYLFPNEEGEEPAKEIRLPSSHHHEQIRQDHGIKAYDGFEGVIDDSFKHGQSGSHERLSKGKSKRLVDNKHYDEKARNTKRLKSQNFSQPLSVPISSLFGESPSNSSPDRPLDVPDVRPSDPPRTSRDGSNDPNSQTCFQLTPVRSVDNTYCLGQKSSADHVGIGAPHGEKRPGKHVSLDLQTQKASNAETSNKDGLVNDGWPMKFSAEDVGTESNYRKPAMPGKVKEAMPRSNSRMSYSPKAKDNKYSTTGRYPVMNSIGGARQREHSDPELGELREPFHDETPGQKKQVYRKSSSRHVEYKQMNSEQQSSDFGRGQPSKKITGDSGKLLPSNSEAVASSILDATSKKKALESDTDDLTRPNQKSTQTLLQHNRGNHIEVRAHQNKGPENSSRSRFAEAGTGPAASLDSDGDPLKKVSVNSTELEHNSIQVPGHNSMKGNTKQRLNLANDTNGRRKDASMNGKNDGSQNRKEPSSDGNCSPYTKYENQEPELKGPIKDYSQYEVYVKEYQEKYHSYCSLKKTLESYSDEFSKLEKDLESYKFRDLKRYKEIEEQIMSSFRQYGERHKRHKKIFILLYQELKHLKQMIKDYVAS